MQPITHSFIDLNTVQSRELLHYTAQIVGEELSKMSQPCYMPKVIKYKTDFLSKAHITDKTKKQFMNQLEEKYRFNVLNDTLTVGVIMCIVEFSRREDANGIKLMYLFLAIKFYSSLMHISFPRFCNDELWRLTLSRVSPKHLFREKNGVPNALVYLIEEIFKRYHSFIITKDLTDEKLIRFVFEIRHRLSQSLKSFAEIYYKIQKTGEKGTGGQGETDIKDSDNLNVIADKIAMSMCTFEQIDGESMTYAIQKTSLNKELCYAIIDELSTVEYMDEIKFIILLMGKNTPLKNMCKEQSRMLLVRRVENNLTFGNYVIKDVILDTLNGLEVSYRLKTIDKSQLVMFVSHYLTKYIQTKIC